MPAHLVSTHRLQLEPDFTLDDAVAQVDHLATLGITHLYLSPVLQATVRLEARLRRHRPHDGGGGLGGDAGFARLVEAAHEAGLGVVVDVVPNHMTTPTPLSLNRPLWSVLREGRSRHTPRGSTSTGTPRAAASSCRCSGRRSTRCSPRARSPSGSTRASRSCGTTTTSSRSRPAPTSGMPLGELLDAQHYRLASWTVGDSELNYRRFFDVTSLIAVRVEDPEVFDATHAAARRRHPVGRHRRPAHRPPRRPRRPRGLPRAARRGDRRRVGRRREDPRGRRAAAAQRGGRPAPPATTRCCASAGSSSTPPVRSRSTTSRPSCSASGRTSRRSSRSRSAGSCRSCSPPR